MRSESRREDDDQHHRDDDGERLVLGHDRHQHVGADRDELAMGEVDQAHDAEDEADPERRQRVEGAHAQRIDDDLYGDGHASRPCSSKPK